MFSFNQTLRLQKSFALNLGVIGSNHNYVLNNLLPLTLLQVQNRGIRGGKPPPVVSGNPVCSNINFRNSPVPHKHWNKKWKKFRMMKVIKVELPNFNEAAESEKDTPDEIRAKMKERGIFPPRPWMERPYEVSSTADIFEPYVPPEGDGKASLVSKEGAKQTAEIMQKKSKTWMSIRKIRRYDEEFDPFLFAQEAQQIYLDVHQAVADRNKEVIRRLVTEKAYPEITHNMKYRTIRWKFLESLEPAKAVYSRYTDVITKENIFAQITCRFFTKQTLAIYDRFGRLAHGSEVIAKDVLEYVVFEKHLANTYGTWRIHGKIIPDWAPSREKSHRTFRVDAAN